MGNWNFLVLCLFGYVVFMRHVQVSPRELGLDEAKSVSNPGPLPYFDQEWKPSWTPSEGATAWCFVETLKGCSDSEDKKNHGVF